MRKSFVCISLCLGMLTLSSCQIPIFDNSEEALYTESQVFTNANEDIESESGASSASDTSSKVASGTAAAVTVNSNNNSKSNTDSNESSDSFIPSEANLHDAFSSYVGSETERYFICEDFDCDGSLEAFAVTSDTTWENTCVEASLYYIASNGDVSLVNEDYELSGYFAGDGKNALVEADGYYYLVWYLNHGGSGNIAYIYGVKNGAPYEPQISRLYSAFGKSTSSDGYIAYETDYSSGWHNEIERQLVFDSSAREFIEKADAANAGYNVLDINDFSLLLEGYLTQEQLELVLSRVESDDVGITLSNEDAAYYLNVFCDRLYAENEKYSLSYSTKTNNISYIVFNVNDINRLYSVFTDYTFSSHNSYFSYNTASGYPMAYIEGDKIYVGVASTSDSASATITSAMYNDDEMIIEYHYKFQRGMGASATIIEDDRRATLKKTESGRYKIAYIESI